MKVAVFNRYWTTYGGGERYAGALAQALATDHEVHPLSPEHVDWPRLEEWLGLDLSRTTPRLVPDNRAQFTALTREYDLLVTSSFMSTEFNGARRGIYVVLFPALSEPRAGSENGISAVRRVVGQALSPVLRGHDRMRAVLGNGFHPPEHSGTTVFRWTGPEAHIYLTLPPRRVTPVRLTFAGFRPTGLPPATVLVEADDRVLGSVTVGGDRGPVDLDVHVVGRGADVPTTLVIRSDTFVPGDQDLRELGVPLAAVQVGRGARAWLLGRYPPPTSPQPSGDFLATYQQIVSISEFTQRWVRRRWGRDSRVIYPPVSLPAVGERKDPLILSVGRFFDEGWGHSKKQLELVQAFRALCSRGLRGWELHLVGSCQARQASYLTRVKAEAEGLPVHFHINATGRELSELYRRATVYWHATGLNESERVHPERCEHFGISTVEAMGARAVPVVVGKAGQKEVVQHDVNGYHFTSVDDLVARTHRLVTDRAERTRLADAARRRAAEFSTERFAASVRELVAEMASG
jgi:glycosyltransferase involved in cell wall biosynthesis